MPSDDDIIEATAVVVHQEQPKVTSRWQATVKAKTDHKLERVENFTVIIEGLKPTKNDAWTTLVPYIVPKVNRSEVRKIFEAMLFGAKPKPLKSTNNRFSFLFETPEEGFIEQYDVTFIEL